MKKNSIILLLVTILSLASLISCSQQSDDKNDYATITIKLPKVNTRARFNKELTNSYNITLYMEDGEVFQEPVDISAGEDAVFENIPFGTYQVKVKALSEQGKVIATGESEVFELNSTEGTSVSVMLILGQYFNINYELDGGINSPDNPSIYTYEDLVTLEDPEKENFDFEGWFTENTFENKITSIDGEQSLSDITLYAKWIKVLTNYESCPPSGTYYIKTPEDLKKISEWANGGTTQTFSGYTFILYNDIEMNPEETWKSIGYGNNGNTGTAHAFKGNFDGAGHEISSLKIESTSISATYCYPAFIGCLSGGTVKNLTLRGTSFSAGFVGFLTDGEKIDNCKNYMDVTGQSSNAGGIVASYYKGYVTNCENYGTITTTNGNVGGIAGDVNTAYSIGNSYIEGCRNYGEIYTTNDEAGGIVGFNRLTVYNCENYGKISSQYGFVGGITGTSYSTDPERELILNCINKGEITSIEAVGGISGSIGSTWGSEKNYQVFAKIRNCVNMGTVSISSGTETSAGGIVGAYEKEEYNSFKFTIENCYSLEGKCDATIGSIITEADTNVEVTENAEIFTEDQIDSVVNSLNTWASSNTPYAAGTSYKTWKATGNTISF